MACTKNKLVHMVLSSAVGVPQLEIEVPQPKTDLNSILYAECTPLDAPSTPSTPMGTQLGVQLVCDDTNLDETTLVRFVGSEHYQLDGFSCPLCDIIIWMVPGLSPSTDRKGLALVLSSSLGFTSRFGVWRKKVKLLTLSKFPIDLNPIDMRYRFAAITNTQYPSNNHGSVQATRPQFFEIPKFVAYERVKAWFSTCESADYTKDCQPSIDRQYLPARVIDCLTQKIVSTQPSNVRDAISVTVKLGFRYLWVDRYCIDPNNLLEKHAQIRQMGSIYNGVTLTIIAAAGSNPDYGLPGVPKARKRRPPSRTILNWTLVGLPDEPCQVIRKSVWVTRAWTYQEALLSKRRLFFTDQQTNFECQTYQFEESHAVNDSDVYLGSIQNFSGGGKLGLFPVDILQYISSYSKRRLTYDDDYLNKFMGILEYLSKARYATFHLQGVPVLPPVTYDARALPSWPIGRNHASGFMIGMTWRVGSCHRRRGEGFPSWSWVGWTGAVYWPHNEKELVSLQELCEQSLDDLRTNYSLPAAIHIESKVFEVSLVYHPQKPWLSYTGGDRHRVTTGKIIQETQGGYEVVGYVSFALERLYIRSDEKLMEGHTKATLFPQTKIERVRLI
ncbi:HET-domain-containing protein [Hypoxylon trugodes]|uniref:HET-domain-containing protein n=1 Tax=Hypoxylon trugodes TaxID=326681 RepID=UPI00219B5E58|nr:HET-domain-containing protein [Hypoxylon trugodes]KAI1383360.1 HET-domain-containing protein [Hypoxylon trugodes]